MVEPASEAVKGRRKRETPFAWLGRAVGRHPWYPILLWVAILGVSIPAAANVGSVISNSFGNTIPSSDQSVIAQNEFQTQFPGQGSSPSSSLVLLEGPAITGPVGKNATLAVDQALQQDPRLKHVGSVTSLYSAYEGYLTGEVELGLSFLGGALNGTPSLPQAVNLTSSFVWGAASTYVRVWGQVDQQLPPGTPASEANWPAFDQTRSLLSAEPSAEMLLTTFYNGTGSALGFNQSVSTACLSSRNITPCADSAMRATLAPMIPTLFQGVPNQTVARLVLQGLGVENVSSYHAVQVVGSSILASETGLAPSWVLRLWELFPGGMRTPASTVSAWVAGEVASNPVGAFPLPIPGALWGSFVSPSGKATLVVISFTVSDNFNENGSSVTYQDVDEINQVVSRVLSSTSTYVPISHYETGEAPLDGATNYLATSALSLLLALTVVTLIAIMLFYFRAPAAPLVSFGLIGVALAVSLGIMFLVGTFVTTFNSEVESVVLVFLMSIGTDYSVFLMARYREELVRGTPPREAVETTVRWAGQSITTSGLAVVIVTTALTFSGIGPLSQFGYALTFSVLVALLVNLTLLPSILILLGPRVFWPYTGRRFERYAERRRAAISSSQEYIARAGRLATRRPVTVIAIILLLSAPVVVVALQVPVSYDITNIGLPASEPAQQGFDQLNSQFGSGYSSGSYLLVTFSAPVLAENRTNAQEFRDIAALVAAVNSTPGVATADSLVGGGGAPLDSWLNYSELPPAQAAALSGVVGSYVGVDGRTVLIQVTTNVSGYSGPAVSVMGQVRDRVQSFESSHPEVTQVLYGGAAQTTSDLRDLVNRANEGMLIGAALGLFIVLLIILGSAFVPILALGAIGLSILWAWASTYFVVGILENEALIFLLPLILLIMVLGLGMDYNVLLLTRVREERARGKESLEAIQAAVTHAGGVITAAAVILGGAFLLLGLTSPLGMLAGIGLGIGIAVLLQAFVVQTYLTPAVLALGKDWIWKGGRRSR
jgi:RND superfamily putative drug exporter